MDWVFIKLQPLKAGREVGNYNNLTIHPNFIEVLRANITIHG